MNDFIYGVEFKLPEYLDKKQKDIALELSQFIIEVFKVLYPDDVFPENVISEVMNLILPGLIESMLQSIDELLED